MRTIGLDVETTKIPRHHPWHKGSYLVAVGIADENGQTQTWVFNHKELDSVNQRQLIEEIQEEINNADRIVGHNLKFDINWLRRIGINFDHAELWCTQVTEYLLRGQRGVGNLHLDDLCKHYGLTPKIDKVKTFWDAGYETDEIPLNILIPYLEQDCINALAVFQRQAPKVAAEDMQAMVKLQCENTRVLSDIECNGFKWDQKQAEQHIANLKEELAILDTELKMAFGWNVNLSSPDELSVALYGGVIKREGLEWVTRELKFETKLYQRKCIVETPKAGVGFKPPEGTELKKEGYYSTDKNVIKSLKAKTKKLRMVKENLIKRSKTQKALETFAGKNEAEGKGLINKIQEDGCIHSQYNQTVTKTGRLSSKDPNGQNLPRKGTSPIKQCIVPRFDWILNADLSQIEWRAAAFLSQDVVMLQEIRDGVDCHTDNAIRFFKADPKSPKFKEIRTIAKIFTFRLLYGGSPYGFYMDQNMPNYSLKEWERIVESFYEKYKGLKRWQDENIRKVYRDGGILRNPTGRKFVISKDHKGYKVRNIKNYPVQSFATADITPLSMVIIHREMRQRKLKSKMIAQVHDSIVFDVVGEELDLLVKICLYVFENLPKYIEQFWGFPVNVPLGGECEYGKNYGEMQEYALAA